MSIKETKTQKAKRMYGVSGSVLRAMRRNGLDINNFSDAVASYKALRKKRRLERKKVIAAKRDQARAGRRSKSETKTTKKKK